MQVRKLLTAVRAAARKPGRSTDLPIGLGEIEEGDPHRTRIPRKPPAREPSVGLAVTPNKERRLSVDEREYPTDSNLHPLLSEDRLTLVEPIAYAADIK